MPLPPSPRRSALVRNLGIALLMLGIDPRRAGQLRYMPRYLGDLRRFRAAGGEVAALLPVLGDYTDQAGAARGHYFHQDLLVAGLIHDAVPERHIDIGSRLDGFVAHVAAFRPIEVIDVRALDATGHPNIRFVRKDLMDPAAALEAIADSVSCLHAIEHFGLGRYGDPITPDGHIAGFRNIVRMVRPGGRLYMGFPIGSATQVHFNAHRIFHPTDIFGWSPAIGRGDLVRFDYVDDAGDLQRDADPETLPPLDHGCGIYTFEKPR